MRAAAGRAPRVGSRQRSPPRARRRRPHVDAGRAATARRSLAEARGRGWEGLVAKDARVAATARARRTREWRKLKLVKRAGVRRRRLDGAARLADAASARCCSGCRARRPACATPATSAAASPRRSSRASARLLAALRDRELSVREASALTNETPHWVRPGAGRRGAVLRRGPTTGIAAPRRSSWACATTCATVGGRVEGSRARRRPTSDEVRADEAADAGRATRARRATQIDALAERGGGTARAARRRRAASHAISRSRCGRGSASRRAELLRYYLDVAPQLLPVRRAIARWSCAACPTASPGTRSTSTARPTRCRAGVRAERVAADNDVPTPPHRRLADDAALHGPARRRSRRTRGSRARSRRDDIDFAAIDLDPMEGAPFSRVRDVARWVHDELEALGVDGLRQDLGRARAAHLPADAAGHAVRGGHALLPDRRDARRGPAPRGGHGRARGRAQARAATVYLDCLQNIHGKTLACAYSARASDFAGASAPLAWDEIDDGARPARLHDPHAACARCARSAISGRRCARRRGSIWRRRSTAPTGGIGK